MDDEDVIIENSVLHQVLQEYGVEQVPTEPGQSNHRSSMEAGDGYLKATEDHGGDAQHGRSNGRLSVEHLDLMTQFFVSTNAAETLFQNQRRCTLKRLLSSNLLLEDDALFLNNFVEVEPLQNVAKRCRGVSYRIIGLVVLVLIYVAFVSSLFPSLRLIAAGSVLGCPLLAVEPGVCMRTAALVTVFTLLTFGLLEGVKVFTTKKVAAFLAGQDEILREFESMTWELLHLERKCLRLIQETEMVARGFTIASQRHLASRLGGDAGVVNCQCSELREMLVTRNGVLISRIADSVDKIMADIPKSSPVSRFNPLRTFLEKSVSEDGVATPCCGGTITPGAVKTSVDLLRIFISGYVCRLTLCFVQETFKDGRVNPYTVTVGPTQTLAESVVSLRSALSELYSFYRAISRPLDDTSAKPSGLERKGSSYLENLYTCVNSLDLHLQSVIERTRKLTFALEDKLDAEKRKEVGMSLAERDSLLGQSEAHVTQEEKSLWEDIMKRVKVELESCRECCDESFRKLKLEKEAGQMLSRASSACVSHPDPLEPLNSSRVHIPSQDPVIQDEVFEDVTDPDYDHCEPQQTRCTPEDRERLEMFREISRSFRRELMVVVGEKAKEQQLREARALERLKGQKVKSVSTKTDVDDSSGTGSNTISLADVQESSESNTRLEEESSQEKHTEKPGSDISSRLLGRCVKESHEGNSSVKDLTRTGAEDVVCKECTGQIGNDEMIVQCQNDSVREDDSSIREHGKLPELQAPRLDNVNIVPSETKVWNSDVSERRDVSRECALIKERGITSGEVIQSEECVLDPSSTGSYNFYCDAASPNPSCHTVQTSESLESCDVSSFSIGYDGNDRKFCARADSSSDSGNDEFSDKEGDNSKKDPNNIAETKLEDWVKVSHRQFVSDSGSRFELTRQKDVQLPAHVTPSPNTSFDSNGSFSASIAAAAARQALLFRTNVGEDEIFTGDDDLSDASDLDTMQ